MEYSIKGEMINGDSKNYNTKANILTALESAKCSPPLKLNGAGYYGAVQVCLIRCLGIDYIAIIIRLSVRTE